MTEDLIIYDEAAEVTPEMWDSLCDRDPRNYHGKNVVAPPYFIRTEEPELFWYNKGQRFSLPIRFNFGPFCLLLGRRVR